MIVLVLSLGLAPRALSAEGESLDITGDTVWEGTVELSQEIRVHKGATLLVLPGTTVRFSTVKAEEGKPAARLVVQGTLVAQGTADAPILFTSGAETPAPGDWDGLIFERSNERPSRLRHVTVEYAVEGIRGAYSLLLVEDSLLRRNIAGVNALRDFKGGLLRTTVTENETGLGFNQNSSLSIEGCTIEGNSRKGIDCTYGSSPSIRNSSITGNGEFGIVIVWGSSPLVEGNLIQGHGRGITVHLKSRPRIVRNEISENETGIWAEKLAFPTILGNVISRNGVGIYCNYSGYPEVSGNNLTDNERFALVLGDNMSIKMEKRIPFRSMGQHSDEVPDRPEFLPPKTRKLSPFTASDEGLVDARGNWWGETALEEMERLGEKGNITVIEDFHDKPDTRYGDQIYPRDRVVFSPWETEPLPDAGVAERTYGGVKGKVISEGIPLGGVRVHAYKETEGGFRDEGFSYSAPTGEKGHFSLTLSPGTYFLVAKRDSPPFPHRNPGPGEYFGYYGGNPVTVSAGVTTDSNIQVVRRREQTVTAEEGREGAVVEGTVEGPEGPLEGASVHVYSDAARQFRGPGLFGPQGAVIGGTDSGGRFSIDLPAGTYYLVASKRRSGGFLGPLQPGDLHGWYDGNPVVVAPGSRVSATLQVVEKLKETARPGRAGTGATGIRGTIHDPSGKVPPGVYAYATTDPSFMIGAMPPYRSRPVTDDGSYTIDLPEGGTYYVGARSGYGGPPLPGEWHGFLGGDAPSPVAVKTGEFREGTDFTVRKME